MYISLASIGGLNVIGIQYCLNPVPDVPPKVIV